MGLQQLQYDFGWKIPLRKLSLTVTLMLLSPPLNHAPSAMSTCHLNIPWSGYSLTPLTAGHQLDVTPFTTALQPWPSSQFLQPGKSVPIQATGSQFLQENAVGDSVKGFSEVWVDNIHSLSSFTKRSCCRERSGQTNRTRLLQTQAGWT